MAHAADRATGAADGADSPRILAPVVAEPSTDPGRRAVPFDVGGVSELLESTVGEAASLLRADGAMVYLLHEDGWLRLAHDAGITNDATRAWAVGLRLRVGDGMFGRAVEERRGQLTGDYAADDRFRHAPEADRVVAEVGIRSMVVEPLVAGDVSLGALGAFSEGADAFDEAAVALLRALARHAAIAIANAQLIADLDTSRAELARTASAEHSLREIAGRLARIRDPAELLQHAVDAAASLSGVDWAEIATIDPDGTIRWRYESGIGDQEALAALRSLPLRVGEGVLGRAVAERRVVVTGDYMADTTFRHAEQSDAFVRRVGFRSLLAVPLETDQGVVGVLGVHSSRPNAFGPDHVALIAAFGDVASAAMGNAHLISELAGSRAELARRVETETSLREIASRITQLRDPSDVLEQVVMETRRLLRCNDALLVLLDDPDGDLTSVVESDAVVTSLPWGHGSQPLGTGLNRLAITEGATKWTRDYMTDERIPKEMRDRFVGADHPPAALAAAPLRAPAGAIVGTLTVIWHEPRDVTRDEIELLEGLADQAAIVIGNIRLYDRLRESEARYRGLLAASPDIVFFVDAAGKFTYLSETVERLLDWKPSEVVGQPFSFLIHSGSMEAALERWQALQASPGTVLNARFDLIHRDGRRIPFEVRSAGLAIDGQFAGVQGSARDVSERDRLERDLRDQAAELAASRERAHLARELHDSVTQAIFSMTLVTRSIQMLLERDPAAVAAKLETLRDLQADAMAEMRALIFELRPASLETDGLVRALRTHTAAVQGRTGLAIVIEADGMDGLPIEVESGIFRIAQEALHNVVKHAGAHQVRISLGREDGRVRLVVVDDGAGFDPAGVSGDHLGLAGMRARAERLGGHVSVQSSPGHGTRIEALVAVPAAAGDASDKQSSGRDAGA